MRTLTPHDDAGAVGVAGEVDHAGQLGGLCSVAQGSVLFQGRVPDPVGQGPDVVQEAQQRVVAEAALVGGDCLLLLGVAGDQGGVEVQDQAGQVAPARAGRWYAVAGVDGLQPGDVACGGPGFSQGGQCGRTDVGEKTPGGGCGGDRAEHLALVTQDSGVSDGLAAVGEHHGQVDRRPAGGVPRAARPQPTQRAGEGAGQPGDFGWIGRQTGSGMADHPATVGRDDESGT